MSYFDKDRSNYSGGLGWAKPGLKAVGEYQASGRPWLKTFTLPDPGSNGSTTSEFFADDKILDDDDAAIEFPFIAKSLSIKNDSGAAIQVYFCSLRVPSQTGTGPLDDDGNPTDVDGAGTGIDVISRGNKVTDAELNAYNGASDNRPDAAVKENGTYWVIADGESLKINTKCKRAYISGTGAGSVSLYAELTNIDNQYNCDYRGLVGISGGTTGTLLD